MGLFVESEGDVAILASGGKYFQVPVYTRNGFLYAKVGGGFVKLMSDGSTTVSKMRLDTLSFEGDLAADPMGRLCLPSTPTAKSIEQKHMLQLGLVGDE